MRREKGICRETSVIATTPREEERRMLCAELDGRPAGLVFVGMGRVKGEGLRVRSKMR